MKKIMSVALATLLLSVFVPITATAEATTQTLTFEDECMDLDTGIVENSCQDPSSDEPSWDVLVAHNTDRSVHSAIFPNARSNVEISHLVNKTFEQVTVDDIASASFMKDAIDEPFDTTLVILIRTDLGAVYKLGNATEDENGLNFDYEILSPCSQ